MQTVGGMLENPTEAVNDLGYFDCIDSVMENSKVPPAFIHSSCQETNLTCVLTFMCVCVQILGEAMAGISHNAKNSNLPEFGDSVSSASKALCGLTEAAAQVKTL